MYSNQVNRSENVFKLEYTNYNINQDYLLSKVYSYCFCRGARSDGVHGQRVGSGAWLWAFFSTTPCPDWIGGAQKEVRLKQREKPDYVAINFH